MTLLLDVDPLAEQQIAVLPQSALSALAEALGVLEFIVTWMG